MFELYFQLGFQHIADLKGYDHILFIIALCAIFSLSEWKKILILITAFTIGHSITLALASLQLIQISSRWVEFLIPVTIIITSLSNIMSNKEQSFFQYFDIRYLFALCFGLIHGLGFSNYLRSLLSGEENIVYPLFAFNIGLEIGQLLIVLLIMLITFVGLNILKVKQREWTLFWSGAAAGIAFIMALERLPL